MRFVTVPDSIAIKDKVDYLQELVSPRTRSLLRSTRYAEQVNGIEGLAEEIRHSRLFPDDILATWYGYTTIRCASNIETATRYLFRLSFVVPDGTLLTRIPLGPASGSKAPSFDEPHDVRLAVHVATGTQGAVLAVDSWRSPATRGRRRLGVVWRHKEDLGFVAEEMGTVAFRALGSEGQDLLVRAFSVGGCKAERCHRGRILPCSEKLAGSLASIEYLEVHDGQVSVYADGNMLDDEEMQAGVVFDAGWASAGRLRELAGVIAATSAVLLGTGYVEELLRWCLSTLRVLATDSQER
jgi:hypothetical protein